MREHLHRLKLGRFGGVPERPKSNGSVPTGGGDSRIFRSPRNVINNGGVSAAFVLRLQRDDVEDEEQKLAVDVANRRGEVSTGVGESQTEAETPGGESRHFPIGNAKRLTGNARPGDRIVVFRCFRRALCG